MLSVVLAEIGRERSLRIVRRSEVYSPLLLDRPWLEFHLEFYSHARLTIESVREALANVEATVTSFEGPMNALEGDDEYWFYRVYGNIPRECDQETFEYWLYDRAMAAYKAEKLYEAII